MLHFEYAPVWVKPKGSISPVRTDLIWLVMNFINIMLNIVSLEQFERMLLNMPFYDALNEMVLDCF